jgi:hypothetical protein
MSLRKGARRRWRQESYRSRGRPPIANGATASDRVDRRALSWGRVGLRTSRVVQGRGQFR